MSYIHISKIAQQTRDKIELYQTGALKPLFTSSKKETELIHGIYPGDILTIAAASGIGKSSRFIKLLLDFCDKKYNPTMQGKIRIYFDTWEMADWKIFLRMLAAEMFQETKFFLKENSMTARNWQDLDKAVLKLSKLPIRMHQIPVEPTKYADMKAKLCEAHPDDLLIFGMDHTRMGKQGDEKTEERMISAYLQHQVVIKNTYSCIFINLSQMNRNYELRSAQGDLGKQMPIKSDLFGSESAYQCSDLVMVCHRPGYYGLQTFEGELTGYDRATGKGDNLWVEGWIKQREGATNNIFMYHDIKHMIFKDL